jgi:hypothetical protein
MLKSLSRLGYKYDKSVSQAENLKIALQKLETLPGVKALRLAQLGGSQRSTHL